MDNPIHPLSRGAGAQFRRLATENLSLLIWIGKADILSINEERKILENLKSLHENFQIIDLKNKTDHMIQIIRNTNLKTQIIEHITDIEYKACIEKKIIDPINLYKKFEKIINILKSLSDKFYLMELERELKDIKTKYFQDPKNEILLYENLENISIHR